MGVLDATILHHVCIVFVSLWILSLYNLSYPIVYLFSLIYLYLVNERYVMRLERKLRFEERKSYSHRRVNTDSESVRWLNYTVGKMWLVCMEGILSQKILLPIIPWFFDKYKPWTVKNAVVRHLYMGRSPPMFTEIRVLRQCPGDDHLVLELGMNFRSADDMSAILSVKLKKRLGFGMKTKLHLMGLHVEGKMLVGIKFLRHWPFIGRVRVCFAEPPYFQMTVKPIFTRGLDVSEVPGIAGWLDKLLALAFEQTLVEPNMLVVDMEKFVSPQPENWFFVDEKEPVAYALVEIIEATDCKPSDPNGLADPYVKGQIGQYRFRTKIRKKTLSPTWHEEFKVPICTWESPNCLSIEVRDKDRFTDDTLGDCSLNITELRNGQRHDMWLPLRNIKMGRLHLAITVVKDNIKGLDEPGIVEPIYYDDEENNKKYYRSLEKASMSPKVADQSKVINIEREGKTQVWVEKPESEVSKIWERRKGKNISIGTKIDNFDNENSSNEGSERGKKRDKLKKIFAIRRKKEDFEDDFVPSPGPNIKATNDKKIGVKFVLEENDISTPLVVGNEQNSPSKRQRAKSILRNAGHGVKRVFIRKGSKGSNLSVESRCFEEDSISSSSTCTPISVSGELNTEISPENSQP